MSLLPEDSFKQLSNVRKEFDRMFSAFPFDMSFFNNMFGNFGGMKVDVYETTTEVIATCDIPGLEKEDDIQINVDQNMLSIRGSVNTATEINEGNLYRQERYAGSFYRSISLPSPVSRDGVKATYRNGVLEVRMQKTAQKNIQSCSIIEKHIYTVSGFKTKSCYFLIVRPHHDIPERFTLIQRQIACLNHLSGTSQIKKHFL